MTRHALGKHSNGLATYPLGASIAELEIECQLNKRRATRLVVLNMKERFFYLRDSAFLKTSSRMRPPNTILWTNTMSHADNTISKDQATLTTNRDIQRLQYGFMR